MGVAGASRFLTTATLANEQGFSATSTGLIENLGTVSLLDVGRSISGNNGIGLSGNARALNQQFLSSSTSNFNSIFSLNVATTSSVEALQQGILALRSSLSDDQLAPSLRGNLVDGTDSGAVTASDSGSLVDESA